MANPDVITMLNDDASYFRLMDGISFPPVSRDLLLQRFIADGSLRKRPLYWRAEQGHATPGQRIEPGNDGELRVARGVTLSFETYFNSFFEATWRRHTSLGVLKLQIEAEGRYEIRVFRRALGRRDLVAQQTAGSGVTELRFADDALNFRQHGVLSLELTALNGPVVWRSAAWLSEQPVPSRTGLGLVFCTFNREADISRVLASIADDPCVLQTLTRITVVNQGRKGLSAHPEFAGLLRRFGSKLRLIEQDNFGGAGGFTRGLLANLDDPDVTHAVLLDDDIDIEPDSLLRMARFFAMATSDFVLGGHMLDSAQPTQLYEAGAVISDRHWDFQPQHHCRDIAHPNSLEPLSHPNAVHYNGWWCCGIPLAVLRQVGLPLPCFIRGDDVELGLRLHQQGIETIPLPGVAVWHEPFYLKLGSWQLYYETRNMLIAAALHQPFERQAVARRMTRHLFLHLLTFRYYSAALILRGIGDFLAGPAILHGSPQALHASLGAVRERYPAKATSRGQVLHEQPPTAPPTKRSGFLRLLGVLLLHQWLAPTLDAPVRRLPVERLTWTVMRGVEHVAVETWWDRGLPTFHRSREDFRSLAGTGLRTMWRLYRHGPRVAAAWQAAHPRLVSVDFWRKYLKLAPATAPVRLSAEIAEIVR
jgi:galactofuranosylgalactofuranosylrhamnosyl-N-acetylglucosaminyl-diphospho-decaprenol beta-1,5/1,6-galactofuranosyltransferase